jgi:lysozyme
MARTSQRGIDLIASFEGLPSRQPYNDPTGHCTAGYGRLLHRGRCTDADVRKWRGLTKTRAKDMLAEDVRRFENCVNDAVKVPLTQNQFDALVSFTFNVGCGALRESTLLRKLNGRDYAGARREFERWNKGGGRVLPGLTRRRAAEAKLFGGGPAVKTDKHIKEVQGYLRRVGWPISADGRHGSQTAAASRAFAAGYGVAKLSVRSVINRGRNYRYLKRCAERGGFTTPHFRFREFASKGNGDIRLDRRLVLGLERYRKRLGHDVSIVSGYRDPDHNRRVGGARSSQHMTGKAADIVPELSVSQVQALGAFNGIGFDRTTGRVRHVDVRDYKATWRYGIRRLIPGVEAIPQAEVEVFEAGEVE